MIEYTKANLFKDIAGNLNGFHATDLGNTMIYRKGKPKETVFVITIDKIELTVKAGKERPGGGAAYLLDEDLQLVSEIRAMIRYYLKEGGK